MSDVAVQVPETAPPGRGILPDATGSFRGDRGRFVPGNPFAKLGGRPKGSRPKLAEMFWRDLHDTWERRGIQVLDEMAQKNPIAFARVVASQMPREFLVKASEVDEMSDGELLEFIRTSRSGEYEDATPDSDGGEESGADLGRAPREETPGGIAP